MKIAFFEIDEIEEHLLKNEFIQHDLKFFKEPLKKEDLNKIKDFDILSTFIYSKIDEEVLSCLSNLKLITTRSAGFNHIDVEECKKRKISVCNAPFYGENTVAEYTFALILNLTRNINKAHFRAINKNFSIQGLKGMDVKDKTIGVIGSGRIGLNVIKIAKAFGMNVLAYDMIKNQEAAKEIGFKYVELDELLKNSDIITLHVPLNKETYHLINKNSIEKMKRGVILVNTSRGEVAETKAIIEALDRGIISAAGLDVIENEDEIKNGKMQTDELIRRNCIITPHIAFYSEEALKRILDATISNIKSFIDGKIQNNL